MTKQDSIKILESCIEEIHNTSIEDYEKIKLEKGLDFNENVVIEKRELK